MAKEQKILAHEPLEQLADNLWRVESELPDMALRRQMVVVRTDDGRLVVHNGVRLDDETRTQFEALGTPAVLIVPSGWHRIDAAHYKETYPDIAVYCPRAGVKDVEKKVAIDGTYEDIPELDDVHIEYVDGIAKREGVMTVTSSDGNTLVFNDIVFNHPHMSGFGGFIMKLLGSSGGPRVTRISRLSIVKNKKALRAHLLRLADTPDLRRIIPAHVDVIDDDAPAVLRRVAEAL